MDRFEMTDMGDVSGVLGMNIARDREKGTITINQRDYTVDVIERFSVRGYNPAYTPVARPELSLNQSEETLQSEEDQKQCQFITGAVMYLGQVFCYNILFTANQLARVISKPLKSNMGMAKHLLRYFNGRFNYLQAGRVQACSLL